MALSAIAMIAMAITIGLIIFRFKKGRNPKLVLVLVFGEFDRSPRMMNHTTMLVSAGFNVNVVAYGTRSSIPFLGESVNFIQLKQPRKLSGGRLVYLIRGLTRYYIMAFTNN